jgi:hypothetical protein
MALFLVLLCVLAGLVLQASAAAERRVHPVLSPLLSLSPCFVHIVIAFISCMRRFIKWRRRRPPSRAGRPQKSCLLRFAKGAFLLAFQFWLFAIMFGKTSSSFHDMLFGTVTCTNALPARVIAQLGTHSRFHHLPSPVHSKEPLLADSHEHHAHTPTSSANSTPKHYGPSKGGATIQLPVKTTDFSFAFTGVRTPDLLRQFLGNPLKSENAPHGVRTLDLMGHIAKWAKICPEVPNSAEFGADFADFMVFNRNFSISSHFHVVSSDLANTGSYSVNLIKFGQISAKIHAISRFLQAFNISQTCPFHSILFALGPQSSPLLPPFLSIGEGPISTHPAFHQCSASSRLSAARSIVPARWPSSTGWPISSQHFGDVLGLTNPAAAARQLLPKCLHGSSGLIPALRAWSLAAGGGIAATGSRKHAVGQRVGLPP